MVYRELKTKERVTSSYTSHGVSILKNEDTFAHLKGLCGNLIYMSLLSMPPHLLEDEQVYSIEQICYYCTKGLIAQSANEILTLLGSICLAEEFEHAALYQLLTHCMLYEVCSTFKLPIATLALFLTQAYYQLTGDAKMLQKQEALRTSQRMSSFADYILLFTEGARP